MRTTELYNLPFSADETLVILGQTYNATYEYVDSNADLGRNFVAITCDEKDRASIDDVLCAFVNE